MTIIGQLKRIAKYSSLIIGGSVLLINLANASSVFKGDEYYQQKKYEQARSEYLAAAEVGSPHAYYQLGTIYFKGQGIEANKLTALLWFSLAAEYEFNDSENIVSQILNNIDQNQREDLDTLINVFKTKYGKQQVQKKYLPEMITANLQKKVSFGGEGKLDTSNDESDRLFGVTSTSKLSDDVYDELYDLDEMDPFDDLIDEFEDQDGEFSEDNDTEILVTDAPIKKNPLDLPYLATIDYDVAPDGSIRNITKVYGEGRTGNIETAIYNYSLLNLPKPTFDGIRINFINRGHIGIHRYDLMQIRGKHKDIYDWVRRSVKKLDKSDNPLDKYELAMLLIYYPWFPQEEGFAVSLLKELAEQGHVNSQYEYGLYLYREQIDPEQAVKWLSLASQYGFTEAQYRLAKILQESPWVVHDEKKALFWYEAAAEKGHSISLLKLAEIKLLASDESLRDQSGAIDILKNIEDSQNSNPEYHYLLAISQLKGDYRNISQVFKEMREAIARGRTLNWDVSKWEDQLSLWSTGEVFIRE